MFKGISGLGLSFNPTELFVREHGVADSADGGAWSVPSPPSRLLFPESEEAVSLCWIFLPSAVELDLE